MRVLLVALALSGCTTTLTIEPQPAGEVALIINPACVFMCDSEVAIQRYGVDADGPGAVTASPVMDITLKQVRGGVGGVKPADPATSAPAASATPAP